MSHTPPIGLPVATPIRPGCRAAVILPVRDEAESLGRALDALAGQVDRSGRPLDRGLFEVIVLANNCRDGSASLARRFAAAEPGLALHVAEVDLPAESAHVGTARKLLMDEACRRLLGAGQARGVIASTDGDSRVAPGWIAAILAAVDLGADAVGGDIRTSRAGRIALGDRVRRVHLEDVTYRRLVAELESRLDPDPADPWPRHYHHIGASLAVTAEAYRDVGGLPPLRSSEDVALVKALRRADRVIRHCPEVRVVTSTRLVGRASGGMADALRERTESGEPLRVPPASAVEARVLRDRRLRDLWDARRRPSGFAPIAEELGLDPVEIRDRLAPSPTFGAFLDDLAPVESDPALDVDASRAIAGLRRRLYLLRPAVLDPVTSSLDPLEEVDPVGLLPPPAQMA